MVRYRATSRILPGKGGDRARRTPDNVCADRADSPEGKRVRERPGADAGTAAGAALPAGSNEQEGKGYDATRQVHLSGPDGRRPRAGGVVQPAGASSSAVDGSEGGRDRDESTRGLDGRADRDRPGH